MGKLQPGRPPEPWYPRAVKLTHGLVALCAAVALVPVAFLGCEGDGGNGSFDPADFDGGLNSFDAAGDIETTLLTTPAAVTKETVGRFEFAATKPASFGCRIDGQTPTPCASPFSTPSLGQGPHTFEVAAVGSDGSVDKTPATYTWTVDLTPPKTTVTKAPAPLDNSVNVFIEFTSNEPATFTCAIDTTPPAACTSPFAAANLVDGKHTFTVTATDVAGNVETPAVTHTWTIDTTLPDTTLDSGPTGTVATSSNVFTFSSPTAGATFECSVDSAFAACTSPHTVSNIADGAHTFRVRAKVASGAVDPTPATRTWTVDTTAPTVTITSGPNGSTNQKTPTFGFSAIGASVVECRIDTGNFAACAASYTTATLSDGNHTFEVRARDEVNNSASATRSFSVDGTAPSVAITGGPSGPTNVSTASFTFTADAGTTTTCSVDGGAFVACASPFTTATLGQGNHTFDVRATDGAGNVGTANRTFSVDTVQPTVTILTGPNGPTNATTGTFTFTVNEPTTNVCRIGTGNFVACTSSFPYGPLTVGSYTFQVQATDPAGNSSTQSRSFDIDLSPPGVSITSGPSGATNITSPSFGFTTTGGATTTRCKVDTGAYAACTSPYAPGTYTTGTHTISIEASDAAGNVAVATRTFTIDTTPPFVTVTNGPTSVPAGSQVTFNFSAETGATTQCRIYQGTPSGTFVPCSSPYTVSAPPATGSFVFEVRATDAAGNSSTATRTFTQYIIG